MQIALFRYNNIVCSRQMNFPWMCARPYKSLVRPRSMPKCASHIDNRGSLALMQRQLMSLKRTAFVVATGYRFSIQLSYFFCELRKRKT